MLVSIFLTYRTATGELCQYILSMPISSSSTSSTFGFERRRFDPLSCRAYMQVVTRFLALQNSGIYRVAIYANDVTAHDIAR